MENEDAEDMHKILEKANRDEHQLEYKVHEDLQIVKQINDQNTRVDQNQKHIWAWLKNVIKNWSEFNHDYSLRSNGNFDQ